MRGGGSEPPRRGVVRLGLATCAKYFFALDVNCIETGALVEDIFITSRSSGSPVDIIKLFNSSSHSINQIRVGRYTGMLIRCAGRFSK